MQSDPPPPPDVFFGGVSSLAEQLDKSVLIVLRDGKHIVGKLSSYDQYGSLVLEHSSERIFAGGKYADKEMGLYFIRGENVVMLSEMSEQASREGGGGGHSGAPALVQGTWEEVRQLEESTANGGASAPSTKRQAAGWMMAGGGQAGAPAE